MKAAFIFSLLALPFLIANIGRTASKNVWGKVIDEVTRDPLYGANVYVPGLVNPLGTITNEKGEFRLWNIPESGTGLSISLNGYKSAEVNIEYLNDSLTTKLLIKLQPAIDPVKPQTLSHSKKNKN